MLIFYVQSELVSIAMQIMKKNITKDETKIGNIIGLITSSYYLSQTIFSFMWGYLFDKINTRFLLDLSFLITGFSSFFYGFSTNIQYIMVFKILMGTTGAVVISKSCIKLYSTPGNESIYATAFTVGMPLGHLSSSIIT
ncbi:hypothetical protein A3Q56_07578, partial [Intoshia linei]